MEQNAFLQRGQRINILHIGHAIRCLPCNRIDIRLRQLHQRQHVRCDVCAAGRNAVGRNGHVTINRALSCALTHDSARFGTRQGSSLRRCQCICKGRQHGLFEQLAHLRANTRGAHALDQCQRQQRMAAQLEEIILPAHTFDAQRLSPDLRQPDFQFTFGRLVCLAPIEYRRGQCLAVDLAVGIERQCIQHHDQRGHHVIGQCGLQTLANICPVEFIIAPICIRCCIRCLTGRCPGTARGQTGHITDQLGALRRTACHHHRLAYARHLQQLRLHLAQLDAKAPHLHLFVDAAQIFQLACVIPAHQVPGAVEPLAALAERAGHEALGRQVRPVHIAPCQRNAAQIQLTHRALRHQSQRGVQHIGPGIGHGAPNGHIQHVIGPAQPAGDIDGCLGGTIHVVEIHLRQTLQHIMRDRGRQCLADADDALQAGAMRSHVVRHERLQHRRHEMDGRDTMRPDHIHEPCGVAMITGRCNDQRRAIRQGPEQFQQRHIETVRRFLQHHIVAA